MLMHSGEYNARHYDRLQMQEEAEQARLAKASNRKPMHAEVLAEMGNMMVNIGTELQERYGETLQQKRRSPST